MGHFSEKTPPSSKEIYAITDWLASNCVAVPASPLPSVSLLVEQYSEDAPLLSNEIDTTLGQDAPNTNIIPPPGRVKRDWTAFRSSSSGDTLSPQPLCKHKLRVSSLNSATADNKGCADCCTSVEECNTHEESFRF